MSRQYKDILIPYSPTIDLIERGSKWYCLSATTVHMVLSLSESYYWHTRWTKEASEFQSFSLEEKNVIKDLAAILEWELMNPCENCPSPETINQQTLEQTIMLQNMQRSIIIDRYDGSTIASINPNSPSDFYDGDGGTARTAALCTAVKNYLAGYFHQLGIRISLGAGLSVLETLGGLTLMFASSAFPPIGAIGAVAFAHGLSQIQDATAFLAAMNDEEAFNAVVCCMNSGLKGLAVNRANFEASLNGCNFTEGTNEFILASLASSDLVDQGNWIMFIDVLGRAYLAAQAGLQDCPCCDAGTITITFDDDLGYTFPAYGGAGVSTKDNTVGNALPSAKSWFGTLNGYPSYYCHVKVLLPCVTTVTRVEWGFRHTNNQNNGLVSQYAHFYSSNGVRLHTESVVDTKTINTWHTREFTVNIANVSYIIIGVARQSTGQTGNSWIDNIEVDYG